MNSKDIYTDKELFNSIAGGDEYAFTVLIKKYDKRIYPFVLKIIRSQQMAEEITQDVFIKIWNSKEKLLDIDRPDAYILTIAAHHTFDQLKKRLNEKRMLQRLSQVIGDMSDNTTNESMDFRDSTLLLEEAVERLPVQQKTVFRMSRDENLNYHEIAERMGLSSNTVRNHLVAALKSVRGYLELHNDSTKTLFMGILLLIKE